MIWLSILLLSARADDYWKTICVCESGKCANSAYKCERNPIIDSSSASFLEDFNFARKNIKNIEVYFNAQRSYSVEFDLRSIAGLTLNFSSYYEYIDVRFIYANGENYGGNFLNFKDKYCSSFFIPIEDTKSENVLKIGGLDIFGNNAYFYMNNGKKTKLIFDSLVIPTSAMKNLTGYDRANSGSVKFIVSRYDHLTAKFSKTSSLLKVNSTEFPILFKSDDVFGVEGSYVSGIAYNDKLTIIIEEGITEKDLPSLSITSISSFEIVGKLWVPSSPDSIPIINKVANLIIPKGDFPFTIHADNAVIKVSGDTVIHGNIDATTYVYASAAFSIITDSTSKVNVSFKGYVDSKITVQSPYLNLNIDNYIHNSTYSTSSTFPIGFSYNEDTCSYVLIKSLKLRDGNVTDAYYFESFPTITTIYTDEELSKKQIAKGFVFIDLPPNSLTATSFKLSVNNDSPSALKGIPGFITQGNCMSIQAELSDRSKLKAFKSKTAYSLPAFICITDGYNKCPTPTGFYENPYTDITSLENGDISVHIKAGYKEINIGSTVTDGEVYIDFTTLDKNDYIIRLEGKISFNGDTTTYRIKSSSSKIQKISIKNAQLSSGFSFTMQDVILSRVTFKSGSYNFGANTNLSTDTLSLDSILKLNPQTTFNEIYLSHDKSYLNYYPYWKEKVEITNDNYKICLKGFKSRFDSKILENKDVILAGIEETNKYTEVCVDHVDSKIFKKLNYESRESSEIIINSMTQSINPINININPTYSVDGYSITLSGNGWDTKLDDNKLVINNGNNFIKVIVSAPEQADNLKIIGTASVLFQVDYSNSQDYCIYASNDKRSCYTETPIDTIQVVNNDFTKYLSQIENNSVIFKFDNTEKPYQIPFKFFDMKKVMLLTSYNYEETSEVEILFNDTIINPDYSLTVFDKIKTVYNSDTPVTARFGQLKINYWKVNDKWKEQVSVTVSQLECRYEHLSQFKSITITDQIKLTGYIPNDGDDVVITLKQDNDAHDIVASISGNVNITVGEGFVKVGKYTFNIMPSDKYDIYFKVTSSSNIKVESTVTSIEKLVKIVFDCDYYSSSFTFTGTFPVPANNEEAYFEFKGEGDLNITTYSNLPFSFYNFRSTEFHFMSGNINTITGPISYVYGFYSSTDGRIRYYNHQPKIITVKIPNGYYLNSIENGGANLTAIYSANLKLEIGKIERSKDHIAGEIFFINTIGNTGSSQITFLEPLPNGLVFGNTTYVSTQVFGKIDDENNFPFVKSPEVLIKAKRSDLLDVKFTFNYIVLKNENLTHGFYPGVSCLGIIQSNNGEYGEVKLTAIIKPSDIPFIIDFVSKGTKTDGELIINEDNMNVLEDLNNLLPNVFAGIVLRLYRDMDDSRKLNLDAIVKNRNALSVEIQSKAKNPYKAYTTLPNSNSLSMIFRNVKAGFSIGGTSSFLAKNVSFIDCEFRNANKFKFSNDIKEINMDVDSFNELVTGGSLSSYTGEMIVNSANVIMFTKDGWEFREDRRKSTVPIAASMFKNIQFQTSLQCMLVIEDETLDSIHSFKFDSFPDDQGTVFFELSRHWGKIKNLNGFKINVNGATSVNLNTASYPIPKLFDIEDSDISYTLETDVYNQFDTITLENNRLFKDENLNMNFQFLPSEFQYVNGDKVFFEGSSNINFVNDVGTLRVNESIFRSRSFTTLSKLETLKSMMVERTAEVTGTFKFSLSSTLQLHWTLTETPMLNHKSFEKGSPQWLELIYDESTVDKNLYREKLLRKNGIVLMKGSFECYSLKNNVKFGGSYAPFGQGNTHLALGCDSSAEGQVLLLMGLTDISDDEDASQGGGSGKGAKVSSGGVAGIVIACAVVVGVAAAGIVYYFQRIKIDRLKNEIPVENNDAYKSNSYETKETTQSSAADYHVSGTEDPFDDV